MHLLLLQLSLIHREVVSLILANSMAYTQHNFLILRDLNSTYQLGFGGEFIILKASINNNILGWHQLGRFEMTILIVDPSIVSGSRLVVQARGGMLGLDRGRPGPQ
jgi:hypothetical protein